MQTFLLQKLYLLKGEILNKNIDILNRLVYSSKCERSVFDENRSTIKNPSIKD